MNCIYRSREKVAIVGQITLLVETAAFHNDDMLTLKYKCNWDIVHTKLNDNMEQVTKAFPINAEVIFVEGQYAAIRMAVTKAIERENKIKSFMNEWAITNKINITLK